MRTWARRTFLGALATAARALPLEGDPQRILLIRPDHLGDLLFLTPTLRFLRQALPKAHLALLVGPWSKPVVERNPNLDEVLTCDFPGFGRRPKASPWEPYVLLWREASRLRLRGFGVALNLRFDFWWGAALAHLAGIPRRLGYDLPLVRPFLSESVSWVPGQHAVTQNLRLAGALTGQSAPLEPKLEFPPSAEAEVFVDQYLAERGAVSGDRLLALHPGSGAHIKQWTVDGFAAVGGYFQRQHGAHVVVTGSAAEQPLARAIAERLGGPTIVAAGDTTVDQLASLWRRCRLVVGVDSGALHLAVAVGTPTVHLFGPADPRLFGPVGPVDQHIVVQADLPCVPCGRLDFSPQEAKAHECMRAITPEQVIAAAERVLALAGNRQ